MKLSLCVAVVFSALSLSTAALAETTAAPQSTTPDPKMEAFIKASTPGEEHKMLQNYVGHWNNTTKMWMSPKAKPEVSQGTTDIESILGGRFIRQHSVGTAMGQPFEGIGITGYDNIKKHFSTLWIDNMGTTMMVGNGALDKNSNAIVDQGSFSCPMSPTGERTYRSVWSLPIKNSFKYEMFSPGEDGKEFRMMEIIYTKAN